MGDGVKAGSLRNKNFFLKLKIRKIRMTTKLEGGGG